MSFVNNVGGSNSCYKHGIAIAGTATTVLFFNSDNTADPCGFYTIYVTYPSAEDVNYMSYMFVYCSVFNGFRIIIDIASPGSTITTLWIPNESLYIIINVAGGEYASNLNYVVVQNMIPTALQ